jgi:hypothetical protein
MLLRPEPTPDYTVIWDGSTDYYQTGQRGQLTPPYPSADPGWAEKSVYHSLSDERRQKKLTQRRAQAQRARIRAQLEGKRTGPFHTSKPGPDYRTIGLFFRCKVCRKAVDTFGKTCRPCRERKLDLVIRAMA